MIETSSKQANNYLQENSQELKFIFAKVKRLQQLNEKVAPLLDPSIRAYCQVANIIGHKLVLLAANGSIATQLRFQQPDILRKFQQDPDLQRIKELHLKVSPTTQPTTKPSKNAGKMPLMSPETANIVADIAKSLEDPELRKIMERIAQKKK